MFISSVLLSTSLYFHFCTLSRAIFANLHSTMWLFLFTLGTRLVYDSASMCLHPLGGLTDHVKAMDAAPTPNRHTHTS